MMHVRGLAAVVAAGAAVALLAGACESGEAKAKPGGRGAPPPVPVKVAQAERRSVPLDVAALGTVTPIQTVAVRPRVAGPILEVLFAEGQEVRAGDVLFRIDPRTFEVALAEQEARLARDRTQLGLARTQAGRARAMVQRDLVAREQLDEARTNVALIEATIAVDEVAILAARLELEFTEIASPIDGRTGSLLATAGNLVSPTSPDPLVTIVQLRPIYVAFAVPERELAGIRARQAAGALRVTARPPGGQTKEGELTFLDSSVDPATGTILLKATFVNADGALWAGQFVDVTLTLGEIRDAVVVPAAAVQTGQRGRFVFVVKPDGTVENRPIALTRIDEREAVVAEGLQGGETVVTDGQLRLIPGSRVKVVEPPARPDSADDAPTADRRPPIADDAAAADRSEPVEAPTSGRRPPAAGDAAAP
ncbi:MAG: efflux RND transporter periplasmic adaptor subunit [Deltaproteobacteria bacterium]|nr:efflux RND transporter periplasmic adaptor subunit [Deltaproteobacteria bacterium]